MKTKISINSEKLSNWCKFICIEHALGAYESYTWVVTECSPHLGTFLAIFNPFFANISVQRARNKKLKRPIDFLGQITTDGLNTLKPIFFATVKYFKRAII